MFLAIKEVQRGEETRSASCSTDHRRRPARASCITSTYRFPRRAAEDDGTLIVPCEAARVMLRERRVAVRLCDDQQRQMR